MKTIKELEQEWDDAIEYTMEDGISEEEQKFREVNIYDPAWEAYYNHPEYYSSLKDSDHHW